MYKENNIVKTKRQRTMCPIFGPLNEFHDRVLPTVSDVLKYYLFLKYEMKTTLHVREPTISEISEVVAQKIESIWVKSSISHISHKRVIEKIRKCHDKYRNLLKPYKGRRNDKKYQQKLENYPNEKISCLFDITFCKCTNFDTCKCQKDMKIPLAERLFIKDQRLERKMVIGGVDVIATKEKREKRKQIEDERIKRKLVKSDADSMELLELNSMSSFPYTDTDVITLEYQSQNR
ncbi:hypothetical protein AVEN_107201-1 [Araneus ventricosus]|uniref:Uncharacterized protein n=1 Tax=Araneus ventricosus TaxID=182803 RepID=A0A4Y2JE66_ARAVE|nr:hypothetical protein AVEN_107201-1 [Araneus ventricosus]